MLKSVGMGRCCQETILESSDWFRDPSIRRPVKHHRHAGSFSQHKIAGCEELPLRLTLTIRPLNIHTVLPAQLLISLSTYILITPLTFFKRNLGDTL